jgi:hypothetical protein
MAKAKVRLVEDDDGLFVERNGKRIAKRGVGRYAKQWISLEPGFVVYGDDDLGSRLIKSTIQERRPDRQRRDNFEPVCHNVLRYGGSPSAC